MTVPFILAGLWLTVVYVTDPVRRERRRTRRAVADAQRARAARTRNTR